MGLFSKKHSATNSPSTTNFEFPSTIQEKDLTKLIPKVFQLFFNDRCTSSQISQTLELYPKIKYQILLPFSQTSVPLILKQCFSHLSTLHKSHFSQKSVLQREELLLISLTLQWTALFVVNFYKSNLISVKQWNEWMEQLKWFTHPFYWNDSVIGHIAHQIMSWIRMETKQIGFLTTLSHRVQCMYISVFVNPFSTFGNHIFIPSNQNSIQSQHSSPSSMERKVTLVKKQPPMLSQNNYQFVYQSAKVEESKYSSIGSRLENCFIPCQLLEIVTSNCQMNHSQSAMVIAGGQQTLHRYVNAIFIYDMLQQSNVNSSTVKHVLYWLPCGNNQTGKTLDQFICQFDSLFKCQIVEPIHSGLCQFQPSWIADYVSDVNHTTTVKVFSMETKNLKVAFCQYAEINTSGKWNITFSCVDPLTEEIVGIPQQRKDISLAKIQLYNYTNVIEEKCISLNDCFNLPKYPCLDCNLISDTNKWQYQVAYISLTKVGGDEEFSVNLDGEVYGPFVNGIPIHISLSRTQFDLKHFL